LETLSHSIENEDGKDDEDAGFENYFNVKIPPNENWKKQLNLNLTLEEAAFLKDAFLDLEDTLLAFIVGNRAIYEEFKTANSFSDFAKFAIQQEISDTLKKDIILAHDFAELMVGAHIAYNQELQLHFYQNDPFKEKWEDWYTHFKNRMIAPNSFDPDQLFIHTSGNKAGQFIHDWWSLISAGEMDPTRKSYIIKRQERWAKGSKARISNNRRNDVKEAVQLGLGRLEYRFSNAKIIVNDIFDAQKLDQ
jgi:hypothetical protein